MYAGALGDNAVDRYAMFLTSLELSTDIDERRLALTRARDHRLDMDCNRYGRTYDRESIRGLYSDSDLLRSSTDID
jgi:hypothetical protein